MGSGNGLSQAFGTPDGRPANRGQFDRLRLAATGRGERIRTSGLYVPNVALYQAKLHPDADSYRAVIATA
jgi:hypothetical protein